MPDPKEDKHHELQGFPASPHPPRDGARTHLPQAGEHHPGRRPARRPDRGCPMRIPANVMVEVEKVTPGSLAPGDRVVYGGQAMRVIGEAPVADSTIDGSRRRGLRLRSETEGYPMLVPYTLAQWDELLMDRIIG